MILRRSIDTASDMTISTGYPLTIPHDRQADARIARRGFDDGFARREPPLALGLLDHLDRNAVLDAARRVEAFELGENIDLPVGEKWFRRTIGVEPIVPRILS